MAVDFSCEARRPESCSDTLKISNRLSFKNQSSDKLLHYCEIGLLAIVEETAKTLTVTRLLLPSPRTWQQADKGK